MAVDEVVLRWADAINRHDAVAAADLYTPDAVVRDPQYREPLEGRDAIRKDFEAFFHAFPDFHVTVRSTAERDGGYAVEGSFSGTHRGPLRAGAEEIPPTGREMRFEGAGFVELDDEGRIREERRYYDMAGILEELGVGPR